MDSNSIDELINIIVENTEIDEDTARSCILNELALVDDLYKKDFFAELSTTIYKGIGNKVTKVDDIVKVSQEIQEKGDFITVAKAKEAREAKEVKNKQESEAYIAEFVQYKEELAARKAEIKDDKETDIFGKYNKDIEGIYSYTKEDIDKTVIRLNKIFGSIFGNLSDEQKEQIAKDLIEGESIYGTVKKVAEEKGISIEDAHVDVAMCELVNGFMAGRSGDA